MYKPPYITFNSFDLLSRDSLWRQPLRYHLAGHVKTKHDDDFRDLYESESPLSSISAISHLHLQYGIGITKTIVGYNDQTTLDKLPWDWERPSNLDEFERRSESEEHSKIRYLFRSLVEASSPPLTLYPCNIGISGIAGMADMLLVNEQSGNYCFVEIATSDEIENPKRLSNKLKLNAAVPLTFITDVRNNVSPLLKAGISSILLADLDRGMILPHTTPSRPCFNCRSSIPLESLAPLRSQFDASFDSEGHYRQTDLGSVSIRLNKKLRLIRERHHYGSLCQKCLSTWIQLAKDKEAKIRRRPIPPRPAFLPSPVGWSIGPKSDRAYDRMDSCPHSFSPCSCQNGKPNYKGK